jgi:DNA-binding CsgD family transcriptional regulator
MATLKEWIFRFTDACYALDRNDREWLDGLAAAAEPFLGHGLGVAAWAYRKDAWTGEDLPSGVDRSVAEAMWAAAPRYTHAELLDLFMSGRATSATERLRIEKGLDEHPAGASFRALGVKDAQALTVGDSAGRGVALAGLAPRVLRVPPEELRRLERLGAHLLAGHRLRRAFRQVDAVLDPSGRSLHAEGEAREPLHREALTRAVRAFDQARAQRGGQDADDSLAAFEGLVAGRWSIVQTFESDGRRYLVAIQNQPGQIPAAALRPSEAHALLLRAQGLTNKLVAYELGLAESSVHHLVHEGMRKLGVPRESDLPLLFRQQAARALATSQDG